MKSLGLALALACLTFGCSQNSSPPTQGDPNNALYEESPPLIGIGPVNGQGGFCTISSKCSSGQGDCNNSVQCMSGLMCINDKGSLFGFAPGIDMCLPAHCGNNEIDQDEEGLDCGGSDCGLCPDCPEANENGAGDFCSKTCPCSAGQGDCDSSNQCAPGLTCGADVGVFYGMPHTTDVCVVSHCANNVLDGDEVQIDCGGSDCGSCPTHALPPGDMFFCTASSRCTHGQGDCDSNSQCVPGSVCTMNVGATFGYRTDVDVCIAVVANPTCNDGIQNQGEEAVDCGGPCSECPNCFDGLQNQDEESVDCGGAFCEACPNCFDGIANGGEEDTDCGGPCTSCASCFDGIPNQDEWGTDCGGTICPPCFVETCFDGIQNQDEADVDCGGFNCAPCPDCFDGIQNGNEEGTDCGGPCSPCASCFNGFQDGDEENVDCGGPSCTPCPSCVDGQQNGDEQGVDCGGTFCGSCDNCFDGIQNQDEEGVDCGGLCRPCFG